MLEINKYIMFSSSHICVTYSVEFHLGDFTIYGASENFAFNSFWAKYINCKQCTYRSFL